MSCLRQIIRPRLETTHHSPLLRGSRASGRTTSQQHLTVTIVRQCTQRRCYAQPTTTKTSKAEEELKRLAREAAWHRKDDKRPVDMLIFHAGTGRTTFIALIKVTSLLVGAFFCGIVTPTYIRSDKSLSDTAQMVACGLIPPLFVALTTAPFVTHVHVRLPRPVATHRASLERYVSGVQGGKVARDGSLSSETSVTLTTMSLIAKPRHTVMPLGELVPRRRRFGLINHVRDQPAASVAVDAAKRKWYHWKPVTQFYVQEGRPGQPRKVRYQAPKADRVEWWIWEAIQQRLPKPRVDA